jgi:NAD-dependent SIR2 family protein deacetylase
MNDKIKEAQQLISEADAIVITAGAGMGVDSGLPDFRGHSGLWKEYPAIKKRGLRFNEIADARRFVTDVELAWAFYGHRLDLYRNTQPHNGFNTLLNLCESKKGGYFIYTSNVDGQFQKAGFENDYIYECHGSIHSLQCIENCQDSVWSAHKTDVFVDKENFKALSYPKCLYCDEVARPNILMFSDSFWNDINGKRQVRLMRKWLDKREELNEKVVIIEIGAGCDIPTVRIKSEKVSKKYGHHLIRINPNDEEIPEGINGVEIKMNGLDGIEAVVN